jgi:hypothetical protein
MYTTLTRWLSPPPTPETIAAIELKMQELLGDEWETYNHSFRFVTDNEGHKTAVLLPYEEFQELLADLSDLAALASRINEPTQSLSSLKAELIASGLL